LVQLGVPHTRSRDATPARTTRLHRTRAQGRTYLVTGLNLETRVAFVKPANVRWYTSVRDVTDIHVTGARVAYPTARAGRRLRGWWRQRRRGSGGAEGRGAGGSGRASGSSSSEWW
jgi:hypothetical protein